MAFKLPVKYKIFQTMTDASYFEKKTPSNNRKIVTDHKDDHHAS